MTADVLAGGRHSRAKRDVLAFFPVRKGEWTPFSPAGPRLLRDAPSVASSSPRDASSVDGAEPDLTAELAPHAAEI